MDIKQAKNINTRILEATDELNGLLKDAASRGLKVDLDIIEYQSISVQEPTQILSSKVFVRPNLL